MLTAAALMPLAMFLTPLASSRPRTLPPVMHLDMVDALTPTVAMLADSATVLPDTLPTTAMVAGFLDFLRPIGESIVNDPLWQFAELVGMVWANLYQIRVLYQIRATQTAAAPKLDEAALNAEILRKIETFPLITRISMRVAAALAFRGGRRP